MSRSWTEIEVDPEFCPRPFCFRVMLASYHHGIACSFRKPMAMGWNCVPAKKISPLLPSVRAAVNL
jgi:hypothetical protein